MRNNKKLNKFKNTWSRLRLWLKIVIVIFALALLFFLGRLIWDTFISNNYLDDVSYGPECTTQLDEDALDVLCDFTNQLYKVQKKLPGPYSFKDYDQSTIDSYVPNMTSYFKNPEGKNSKLWQQSLRFLVTGRSITGQDLSINHVSYDLEVLEISGNEKAYKASYYESAAFRFAFLDGITSESYHIPCEITLCKVDGQWKIKSYTREDDFTNAMEIFNGELKGAEASFEKAVDCLKANLERRELQYEDYSNGIVSYDDVSCQVSYDRAKALEYAKTYVKTRNDKDWGVYDEYGGNCQNFASQVLTAGGIPMDLIEPGIWKYYDVELDNTSLQTGRSSSWTTAPYFRMYALTNEGFGLVSTVDANLFTAEPGDVLQVGPYNGEITHSNVVIGTVTDSDDKVIDVLVNSNTSNRVNWPIVASLVGNYSLIKIHGYNN